MKKGLEKEKSFNNYKTLIIIVKVMFYKIFFVIALAFDIKIE